ncbi:MAG: DUF3368 domain-containing protein [Planctomycetes bacterium]|nr:DUF3368 domain-containing protein [Planctomycetota bacterium]
MIVVADTSPLTNLHAIGRLELLREVFGGLLVPPRVADELRSPRARRPLDVSSIPWMEVRAPGATAPLELQRRLHPGETQALRLALEVRADLLLIDEEDGRVEARRLGLSVIGLLGTLVMAKNQGVLPAIRPVVEDLRTRASFWMSDALVEEVLGSVGEG